MVEDDDALKQARRKEIAKRHYLANKVGCSFEQLKAHIESQFKPGMTWENHGIRGWHIDHIRAVCEFDLSDPVQQKACFHYTNPQPLWWCENLAKRFQNSKNAA